MKVLIGNELERRGWEWDRKMTKQLLWMCLSVQMLICTLVVPLSYEFSYVCFLLVMLQNKTTEAKESQCRYGVRSGILKMLMLQETKELITQLHWEGTRPKVAGSKHSKILSDTTTCCVPAPCLPEWDHQRSQRSLLCYHARPPRKWRIIAEAAPPRPDAQPTLTARSPSAGKSRQRRELMPAKVNTWLEEETTVQVALALEGKALEVLMDLQPEEWLDWPAVERKKAWVPMVRT